jgi:hypothetical protein
MTWVQGILVATMLLASTTAQSVMYRWVDQNGSITYSDQPPSNPAAVRRLTVIDGPASISRHEQRTLEIIGAEREKSGGESSALRADPQQATGAMSTRGFETDPREVWGREPEIPPRAFDYSEPGTTPRYGVRPMQPEAVQDPCLRSADPKCHERNRNAYVPYLGYAPSAARAARFPESTSGAGATSGIGGGGAVGASVGPAPAPATPARRPQTMQWRNSLKDAKDLK